MSEYHKIQSIYKRDMTSDRKQLIEGSWSLPEFEYLAHNIWTFTEKVDGTNIRIILENGKITFGGRTANAQIPAKLVSRLNDLFLPMTDKLNQAFPAGVILYGEGYGAKIQSGGGNYSQDQNFVLFDIRCGPWWLLREDVAAVAHTLSIDVVPVVGEGTLYEAISLVKGGILSTWGTPGNYFQAEGIVARPKVELNTRGGRRIITKIKCRDFWV